MKVKLETELITVGLLKELLNSYPNSKPILFEYENGESPVEVIIRECSYSSNLLFDLKDSES